MKSHMLAFLLLATGCVQATAIEGSKGGVLNIPERPSPEDIAGEASTDEPSSHSHDGDDYDDIYYGDGDDAIEPDVDVVDPEYDEDEFMCFDGNFSIPFSWVCDGECDCEDCSDEAVCDEVD